MKCKAIDIGFYGGRLIYPGVVFDTTGEHVPSWAEPVEPKPEAEPVEGGEDLELEDLNPAEPPSEKTEEKAEEKPKKPKKTV